MSIQTQIDRLKNAKDSLKSAIASKGVSVPQSAKIEDLPALVRNIPQEGGSGGSGLIDVTELPTAGIDENAVYRVTESIQTEKNEQYWFNGYTVRTLEESMAYLGIPTVPNIYIVDELPSDMKSSDVVAFTELNYYVLRANGVMYLYSSAHGAVLTMGYLIYQDTTHDKGVTKDINAETESGIYTTFEAFKEVTRYFIRENGEWKEITAHNEVLTSHGFTDKEMLSGDITPRISAAAEIITREITEIKEEWFRKKDGSYYEYIQNYQFCLCKGLTNVIIPSFIRVVYQAAFLNCENLKTVTFKSKPSHISNDIFSICNNLTTINVPWSEDDAINTSKPWGATNAEINFNYTGE